MLTRLEQAQQKWGGSHTIIDKWLAERQALLVIYYKVAGFSPYVRKDHALPSQLEIQTFCQMLLDYLSAGHFEVYDDIAKACELKGDKSEELANKLYPQITETTNVALDFNDKYAEVTKDDLLNDFDHDLSILGEALSVRFELEDQLIDNLYSNHTQ